MKTHTLLFVAIGLLAVLSSADARKMSSLAGGYSSPSAYGYGYAPVSSPPYYSPNPYYSPVAYYSPAAQPFMASPKPASPLPPPTLFGAGPAAYSPKPVTPAPYASPVAYSPKPYAPLPYSPTTAASSPPAAPLFGVAPATPSPSAYGRAGYYGQ